MSAWESPWSHWKPHELTQACFTGTQCFVSSVCVKQLPFGSPTVPLRCCKRLSWPEQCFCALSLEIQNRGPRAKGIWSYQLCFSSWPWAQDYILSIVQVLTMWNTKQKPSLFIVVQKVFHNLKSIKILKIDAACSMDYWIYLFFLTVGTPTCFYQFVHYRWGQNDTSQGDRFSLHQISFHINKWKKRGKTMDLQFFCPTEAQ